MELRNIALSNLTIANVNVRHGRKFVCATCALRGQNRYKRVQFRLVWSAHVPGSFH
ncbi:hypothetical protein ABIF63_006892 [Bradyrhizobium japonicum]|uniref:Uncharacterized protein n=1 Tax=Bradyrhizobium japonicum TaxID=375 RepID=A0ABV2S0U0_BRAJP